MDMHRMKCFLRLAEELHFSRAAEKQLIPTSIFSMEHWEEVTGLAGGALIFYLIVSEGSRLYPPGNLVPVL